MTQRPARRRTAAGALALGLAVSAVVAASPLAGTSLAGTSLAAGSAPAPPPVDASALPTQVAPSPAPGVRQVRACVARGANPAGANPAGADDGPWAPRRLRLAEAWRLGRGKGQRIAVIDTGVALHPRLAGRLFGGGDYVAGGDGLADCDGHGTLVAGIAAAAEGEDGFAGVAPEAEVISIRQASEAYAVPGTAEATRTAGDTASLARAILHAVDLDATVINISEAACVPTAAAPVTARSLQAAVRAATDRGVVVVAAAGNVGSSGCDTQNGNPAGTLVLPAWFDPDVLTVGSVGRDGAASTFSMRGPWVDVAAPGAELVTLNPTGTGLTPRPGPGNAGVQGTSFAAPAVAGLAALVRQRFPALSARQVINRITATAQRSPAGRDAATGYGIVDPVAALTVEPDVLAPPGSPGDAPGRPTGELAPSSAVPAERSSGATVAVGIAALAGLLLLGCVAVRRLRVSLGRDRGRPPSDGPPPGSAAPPWEVGAAGPRERRWRR